MTEREFLLQRMGWLREQLVGLDYERTAYPLDALTGIVYELIIELNSLRSNAMAQHVQDLHVAMKVAEHQAGADEVQQRRSFDEVRNEVLAVTDRATETVRTLLPDA